MKNWSTNESKIKLYPDKYNIWKMEQLINFGLGDEKLSLPEVKAYLKSLDIDSSKRKFLEFLIEG